MSFRDFMEAALYDPEGGYYTRLRGFGDAGDFVTAPETHPVFGTLLARQAVEVWERLGQPTPFQVLEFGGGSGALARSFLQALVVEHSALASTTRYAIEERSASLRERQRFNLVGLPVTWGAPATASFVLANEVLDAFPVHRVVVRGGQPREMLVGYAGGQLHWVESPTLPPIVHEYLARLPGQPQDGAVLEVNPGLPPFAQRLRGLLGQGLALILDYGYLAEEIVQRPQGSLLTYFRHTIGSDPLVRVGQQDISAHVDFSALATAAHHAGLQVLGLTTQRKLLFNLGLEGYVRHLPAPEDRAAVGRLVEPAGLGTVKALFLGAGLGDWVPRSLAGGRDWPEPTFVPALPPAAPDPHFLDQWQDAFGGEEAGE